MGNSMPNLGFFLRDGAEFCVLKYGHIHYKHLSNNGNFRRNLYAQEFLSSLYHMKV